jgi:hypothetical protein
MLSIELWPQVLIIAQAANLTELRRRMFNDNHCYSYFGFIA